MLELQKKQASNSSYESIKTSWNESFERLRLSLERGSDSRQEFRALSKLTIDLYLAKMELYPNWQTRLNDTQFTAEFLSELAKLHSLKTKHMLIRWDSAYEELVKAKQEGRETREHIDRLLFATGRLHEHGEWIKDLFSTFGEELYSIWPQLDETRIGGFLSNIEGRINRTIELVGMNGHSADEFIAELYIGFGKAVLVYSPLTERALRHMPKQKAEETAEAQASLFLSYSRLESSSRAHVRDKNRILFNEMSNKVQLAAKSFAKEIIKLGIGIKPELLSELLSYCDQAPKQNLAKLEAGRITLGLTSYEKADNSLASSVLLLIAMGKLRNAYTILVEELEKQSQELEERKKAELEKYYLKLEQIKNALEQYYAKVESGILDIKKEENTISSAMLALALEIDSFAKKDIQLVDAMNRMAQRQA
ncbi:MAG: hypothetical protein WC490_04830 [Candidatus Margulisiibacteriota bacterium]